MTSLNERQREAVSAPLGNVLVLAGAGSGKTRVLVNRIAWLIQQQNMSPYEILAVTFTNKAAGEMRHRIESLLHLPLHGMWVGTFHSIAHRLLRAHWQQANLNEDFQIIDSQDQYRLIKRILKSLNLDESRWQPKQIQWFISNKKDEGLRPHHIEPASDLYLQTMLRIYKVYEQTCQQSHLVDFSELLLRSYELWKNNPELLQHYQQRFRQILIDEFQDTNTIQYAWLKLLIHENNYMMVVGDDDQSIYGWRGARIENIQRFTRDFSHPKTIRLEQNYRSTQIILQAANALIDHNEDRLGKELWTDGDKGDLVSLYAAFNEIDEARFIANQAASWVELGGRYAEIAILYRSNAQSRVIEEAMLKKNLPYRVYGGLRFFERAEIKDALAYLRLVAARDDDAAFERVVNNPTRGIGERTLELMRQKARDEQLSLWKSAHQLIEEKLLSTRAHNSLLGFIQLIEQLDDRTKNLPLEALTQYVIHNSGLWRHYQASKGEQAQSRLENLEELMTAAKLFRPEVFTDDSDKTQPSLYAFLSHAALESGDHLDKHNENCVQLMTLHAAKGLEFPLVFIAGMEEGLFPHQRSIDEVGPLQEERRLCYVGMTRAMKKLYLSYAELRRHHGKESYQRASRFIREIPQEYITEVRLKANANIASSQKNFIQNDFPADCSFQLGQRVRHQKFGEGVVLNYEGSGEYARVEIQFKNYGTKWLVLSYANLEVL